MSILFGLLIFVATISTAVLYGLAMHGHWSGKVDNRALWKPVFVLLGVSGILMLNRALVVEGASINEAFLILWVMVSIGMFISMASSRFYKLKYKEKGKFKKISRNAFIIGFVMFLLFAVTLPGSNVEENAAATESETVEKAETLADNNEKREDQQAAEAEKSAKEKAEQQEEIAQKKAAEKAERAQKAQAEQEAKQKAKQEAEEKAEQERAKEEKAASATAGLTAVTLYRVVDGDTVHVMDSDNNTLKLRLLLIDTPETVHPNKPVEAFGPEASARMTELLSSAEELHIEYDQGDQTDHYGRHLVYLYADGVSVHEIMLEEGLARDGYIYEQQRYLNDFRTSEQYAKDKQLGIWSLPNYVNTDGEGFNSEEEAVDEVPAPERSSEVQPDSGTTEYFSNCKELNAVYPDGVAGNHSAYQPKMDRDKDNWACES